MAKYAYHQLDANHRELRAAVEAVGGTWAPGGPLDGVIGFRGVNYLVEVKTVTGKLRESQKLFLARWRGQAAVVRTVDELLQVIGAVK